MVAVLEYESDRLKARPGRPGPHAGPLSLRQ